MGAPEPSNDLSLKQGLQLAEVLAGSQRPGRNVAVQDLPGVIRARLDKAVTILPPALHAFVGLGLRGEFALACLECLKQLHAALRTGPSAELGSIDLKLVGVLLQVVICLGMYPGLEPRVGIPLESRTQATPLAMLEDGNRTSRSFLSHLTEEMMVFACDAGATPISRDVASLYLCDLYAVYLQLVHSPNIPENLKDGITAKAAASLERLFTSAHSGHSLEALMSLLRSRPPSWLAAQCSRLLTRILLRPDGILTVFQCLLPGNPAIGTLDNAQLQHVAQIICAVPKQSVSIEEYFANIGAQLVQLIRKAPITTMVFRAATYVVGYLLNKRPVVTKKYVLNPLIAPLFQFYAREAWSMDSMDEILNTDLNDRPVLAHEKSLGDAVGHLRHLLNSNDSSFALRDAIAPVIPPLYYIYDFALQTGSSVRQPALEILISFFKNTPGAEGASVLLNTVFTVPSHQYANLARGPNGGIMLVLDPTRYRTDASRFVTFLDAIDNDDLAGEFFLRLLEGLQQTNSPVRKLEFTELILGVMERYGERIVSKTKQIILFSKNMLMSEDEDPETISLGIALLSAVLNSEETEIPTESQPALTDLLIILQALSSHSAPEIRQSARELRVLIVPRTTGFADVDADQGKRNTGVEEFEEALRELADDLLPVRAHGMHLLRGLILKRDPVLKEKLGEVTEIFLNQIRDEDSFIYLNAIKGLSALTDVYPLSTLCNIVSRYTEADVDLDYRLRVGEALMQTIQRCGDAFAKYCDSLSLLSLVAETSPLALLPFLRQIVTYVSSLLLLEQTVETRRGAASLLLGLVHGLGRKGILFAEENRDVANEIKTRLEILEQESDETTRLKAVEAIGELSDLVQERLGI
ncbi:transmembrane and coiled-coil domains-containing protein 7 [Thoreauomyces humboldtii]|nr:transmembrane and coiled-coil domains-containing protein 7 [Thoreauomyces humboldtii]